MSMNTVHLIGNFLLAVMIVCGITVMLAMLAIELGLRIWRYVEDKWNL